MTPCQPPTTIRSTNLSGGVLAFALSSLLLASGSAYGALIVVAPAAVAVDNTDGLCSLIEAVENAELDVQAHADCTGGDGVNDRLRLAIGSVYEFRESYLGTDTALPSINQDLTIRGRGSILRRNPDLSIPMFRLMRTTAHLSLFNLSFEDGNVTGSGGALQVAGAGTVTCNECRFARNQSTLNAGAVDLDSGLHHVFNDSTFIDNRTAFGYGGAVLVTGGTASFSRSLFAGNRNGSANSTLGGGGLTLYEAEVDVEQSAFLDNSADEYRDGSGSLGGAILVYAWDQASQLIVRNSTISGNVADAGSAIGHVSGDGGLASTFLDLVTVTLNDAYLPRTTFGLFGDSTFHALAYQNSIIHGNGHLLPDGTLIPDYDCANVGTGPYAPLGGNVLDSDRGCPGGSDDVLVPTQSPVVDPERNGGVHALLPGSPALENAIVPFVGGLGCTTGITVDQTGSVRGADGRGCDSGAIQATSLFLFADGFESGDAQAWL